MHALIGGGNWNNGVHDGSRTVNMGNNVFNAKLFLLPTISVPLYMIWKIVGNETGKRFATAIRE
nr:MAG TPA: hypothetical protein [Bacteriophage sp.]